MTPLEDQLLKENDVLKYIKITHNTLYRWMRDKSFPRPIKIGHRKSLWRKTDIDTWLDSLE